MPELLDSYRASRTLGITPAEVAQLAKAGVIPAQRNGCGAWRFDLADLERYRAEHPPAEEPPAPPPEPPAAAPEPVAVAPPPVEADSPTSPPRRERRDDATAPPPPSRQRPRRASDPLPGSGRVEVTLEAVRGYRSVEDYGPEMLRLRAALKVLLRRFGLRCKRLRFPDAEEGRAA